MIILDYNNWSLNESSYIPTISNADIVAATLIGEAGGETADNAMQAIKNVLDNRAKIKGTSDAGEALRPKQFSMWNSVTNNVSVRSDYDAAAINNIIKSYKKHAKWNTAYKIALGSPTDVTKRATLYYAHNKIKPPSWTSDWVKTVVIGNHTFGKEA